MFILFFNVYLFWGERENMNALREGQKEREREPKAGSMLSAEPNAGLDLMTMKS